MSSAIISYLARQELITYEHQDKYEVVENSI